MIESPEELDLFILKDYDAHINKYYLLNANDGKSYITNLTCKIDIKDSEANDFIRAWETLMGKFNIPSKNHSYILYLTQTFYSKLEEENQNVYDVQNASKAVDFFIDYVKEAEFAKARGKFSNVEEAIDSKLKLQVKSPYSGLPITLDYLGSTRLVINLLYKTIKSHDVILSNLLYKFPMLPSIEVLTSIKSTLEADLRNPYQYYLLETIAILQQYLNTYLTKELSRKQHLFIFELLYLFDFLQYVGSANKHEGSDFILSSQSPANKFTSTKRLKDTDKSVFIKTLLKNSTRNLRYHYNKE